MNFIVLTLTNGTPVVINLLDVSTIVDCGNHSEVNLISVSDSKHFSGLDVVETLEDIVKCIDEALGE